MHLEKIVCRDHLCYARFQEFKKIVCTAGVEEKLASTQLSVEEISCLLEITIPSGKNNGLSLSKDDTFPARFPNIFVDYLLGQMHVGDKL